MADVGLVVAGAGVVRAEEDAAGGGAAGETFEPEPQAATGAIAAIAAIATNLGIIMATPAQTLFDA